MFDLKAQLATLDENNHPGLLSVTDLRHPDVGSVRRRQRQPGAGAVRARVAGFIPKGGTFAV